MKQGAFFIVFLWLSAILCLSNCTERSNPKNRDLRTIKLNKILTIRDDGPLAPLSQPYDLQVTNDGSIYFYDNFVFYKFDPQGTKVFNVIRNGQGPGEAQLRTVALVTDNRIFIQAASPPKVLVFDMNGRLEREERLSTTLVFDSLFSAGGLFYGFIQGEPPYDPDIGPGYIDVPTGLFRMTSDYGNSQLIAEFPVQNYVLRGGSAFWQSLFLTYVIKDAGHLFISHTTNYRIVKYNLGLNKTEKVISRKYTQIKRPPEKSEGAGIAAPPSRKYFCDIDVMLIYQNQLWVVTSTNGPDQSRLVDIYDMECNYLESVYLKYPPGISHSNFSMGKLAVSGEYLYSIDEEPDGTVAINKYLIQP